MILVRNSRCKLRLPFTVPSIPSSHFPSFKRNLLPKYQHHKLNHYCTTERDFSCWYFSLTSLTFQKSKQYKNSSMFFLIWDYYYNYLDENCLNNNHIRLPKWYSCYYQHCNIFCDDRYISKYFVSYFLLNEPIS